MAKQIAFETGLVDYEVNGYPVSFNPTDETFVGKLEALYDSLDSLQGKLASDTSFRQFGELDAEMRVQIDDLLGGGASDALFPNTNCYAIADGLPVWMNLVLALLDEVSEAYEREFGKTDARFKAHNAKYQKMLAKYRSKGKR